MDETKHDQVMTKLTKVFGEENLKIGEAISVWYSLGMYLFSHADKEHNSKTKIFEAMNKYMDTVQKGELEKESENK